MIDTKTKYDINYSYEQYLIALSLDCLYGEYEYKQFYQYKPQDFMSDFIIGDLTDVSD